MSDCVVANLCQGGSVLDDILIRGKEDIEPGLPDLLSQRTSHCRSSLTKHTHTQSIDIVSTAIFLSST